VGYDAVEYWPSIWNKGADRPIVHIDVIPAKIENDYNPVVEVIGSIEESLRTLTPMLSRKAPSKRALGLLKTIAEDRARLMAEAGQSHGWISAIIGDLQRAVGIFLGMGQRGQASNGGGPWPPSCEADDEGGKLAIQSAVR
jgi:thiamine pyrophosphate-dependent acetolactate synthase large subunit-like protein